MSLHPNTTRNIHKLDRKFRELKIWTAELPWGSNSFLWKTPWWESKSGIHMTSSNSDTLHSWNIDQNLYAEAFEAMWTLWIEWDSGFGHRHLTGSMFIGRISDGFHVCRCSKDVYLLPSVTPTDASSIVFLFLSTWSGCGSKRTSLWWPPPKAAAQWRCGEMIWWHVALQHSQLLNVNDLSDHWYKCWLCLPWIRGSTHQNRLTWSFFPLFSQVGRTSYQTTFWHIGSWYHERTLFSWLRQALEIPAARFTGMVQYLGNVQLMVVHFFVVNSQHNYITRSTTPVRTAGSKK